MDQQVKALEDRTAAMEDRVADMTAELRSLLNDLRTGDSDIEKVADQGPDPSDVAEVASRIPEGFLRRVSDAYADAKCASRDLLSAMINANELEEELAAKFGAACPETVEPGDWVVAIGHHVGLEAVRGTVLLAAADVEAMACGSAGATTSGDWPATAWQFNA